MARLHLLPHGDAKFIHTAQNVKPLKMWDMCTFDRYWSEIETKERAKKMVKQRNKSRVPDLLIRVADKKAKDADFDVIKETCLRPSSIASSSLKTGKFSSSGS